MKKYHCDGGSIMIGTKESRTCFPNGYGDGEHYVNVVNTEKQKKEFNKEKNWECVGAVEGTNFHVWNYDCLSEDELIKENILYTLSGRYGVYRRDGKITLEKWQ